jgi:hypothetical protein
MIDGEEQTMRRILWLGCLVVAWMAGSFGNSLRAQGQAVIAAPETVVNPVVVQPLPSSEVHPPVVVRAGPITVVNPVVPRPTPVLMLPEPGPPPPLKHRHLKAGWWIKPCGCATADVGCSNCAAETIFFWGSCRAFFGDPCIKAPDSPLLHRCPAVAPPLICPASAPGAAPGTAGGCACR